MKLSARNQFQGKVKSVKVGAVMAEVVVDIGGGHEIVSAITRAAGGKPGPFAGRDRDGGDQGDGGHPRQGLGPCYFTGSVLAVNYPLGSTAAGKTKKIATWSKM